MHQSKEGPDTTMRVGIKVEAVAVAIDAIKTGAVLTIRDAMTGAMARRTT